MVASIVILANGDIYVVTVCVELDKIPEAMQVKSCINAYLWVFQLILDILPLAYFTYCDDSSISSGSRSRDEKNLYGTGIAVRYSCVFESKDQLTKNIKFLAHKFPRWGYLH